MRWFRFASRIETNASSARWWSQLARCLLNKNLVDLIRVKKNCGAKFFSAARGQHTILLRSQRYARRAQFGHAGRKDPPLRGGIVCRCALHKTSRKVFSGNLAPPLLWCNILFFNSAMDELNALWESRNFVISEKCVSGPHDLESAGIYVFL